MSHFKVVEIFKGSFVKLKSGLCVSNVTLALFDSNTEPYGVIESIDTVKFEGDISNNSPVPLSIKQKGQKLTNW
jgi:hypothetical protein